MIFALLFWLGALALAAETEIPKPRGFVSDFAEVIEPETEVRLTRVLEELRAKTGAEIAVVTVDTTGGEEPFDYAMRVAEAWKPGDPGKDNGVVFLVAVRDRKTEILAGYGVEGALPDGKVGAILDEYVIPEFRRGDFSRGIANGVGAVTEVLAEEYGVELGGAASVRPTRPTIERLSPIIALLFFALVVFLLLQNPALAFLLLGGGRGRRFGRGFGGGGFGGGGFGGFGGGGFGGGGAGRSW